MAEQVISTSTPKALGWRRHIGGRAQIAVGLVMLVLIAGIAGNAYFVGQYSPEGAVRNYYAALARGDSSAAWSAMRVTKTAGTVDAMAIDQASLAAALAIRKPAVTSVSTGVPTVSGLTANVPVSYLHGDQPRQTNVTLTQATEKHFGLYPRWKVNVTPAILTVSLPDGSGGLAIDGRKVTVAAGKKQNVAVLPVPHHFESLASPMVESSLQDVDGTDSSGKDISAKFASKLTVSGVERTKQAVKAALAACATATVPNPSGCPNSTNVSKSNFLSWTMIGDPTTDISVAPTDQGGQSAVGHYTFVLSAKVSYSSSAKTAVDASTYQASLQVAPTEVLVTGIRPGSGAQPFQRPSGATDEAALSLVSAGFATCASATTERVVNCPQVENVPIDLLSATNLQWTLAGDPTKAAKVTFDAGSGELLVEGTFDMTLVHGQNRDLRQHSYTTRYQAILVWDGSALRLVSIDGVLA